MLERANDYDQAVALRQVEAGLFLVLLVDVGRLKTEDSVFSMQFDQHGANVAHHVVVTLAREFSELESVTVDGVCRPQFVWIDQR